MRLPTLAVACGNTMVATAMVATAIPSMVATAMVGMCTACLLCSQQAFFRGVRVGVNVLDVAQSY